MNKALRIAVIGVLSLGVCVVAPGANARRRHPITFFNSCPLPADQAGRTYRMTTGVGPCSGDAITVSANNVTIDLAGFTLGGDKTPFKSGVVILPNVTGTRVRHGTITNFAEGVSSDKTSSRTSIVGVDVVGNTNGMLLGPSVVTDSIATNNTMVGIQIKGIFHAGGSEGAGIIRSSLATRNGGSGFSLSEIGSGLVDRSTSSANGGRGAFMAADTSIVRRSTMGRNTNAGVEMLGAVRNIVDRVDASSNDPEGIVFSASANAPLVTRSRAIGNGKSGFGEGILVSTPDQAVVTGNTANGNFEDGIRVLAASATVNGNRANANGWGAADGANFGINAPNGSGHNHARANDGDNQCVDDVLC